MSDVKTLIDLYVKRIQDGTFTLSDVPSALRDDVAEKLEQDE